jgi:hypothetical protein
MSLLGDPIYGSTADGRLGTSVVLAENGLSIAVACYEDVQQIPNPVRVYDLDNTEWAQRSNIAVPNDNAINAVEDVRAMAYANDGNTVAVGTYHNGSETSAVYVFLWASSTWTMRTVVDAVPSTNFGSELCVSDGANIVAVADPYAFDFNGAVVVYHWSDTAYTAAHTYAGEVTNAYTGFSMSLTSFFAGYILVAAQAGVPHGNVHCMVLNADGTQSVDMDFPDTMRQQGDVSVQSNIVAIGSSDNGVAGTVTVLVFGEGSAQIGETLTGEATGSLLYGSTVALSGDGNTVLVASRSQTSTGQVHVCTYTDSAWVQRTILTEPSAGFSYGTSLSLSYSGAVAAIGEPFYSAAGISNGGVVRMYEVGELGIPGDVSWDVRGEQLSGSDGFGATLSINETGDAILVGQNSSGFLANLKRFDFEDGSWAQRSVGIVVNEAGVYSARDVKMSSSGLVMVAAVLNVGQNQVVPLVFRFAWTGTAWLQEGDAQDLITALSHEPVFLQISGNGGRLAISEPSFSEPSTGRVVLYDWDAGNSQWNMIGSPLTGDAPIDAWPDDRNLDYFGITMALTFLGDRVAASRMAGQAVSVYDYDNVYGNWNLVGGDIAQRPHEGDVAFHYQVALSDDHVLIGESGIDIVANGPSTLPCTVRLYSLVNASWTVLREIVSGIVLLSWTSPVAISRDSNVVAVTSFDSETWTMTVKSYIWQPEARAPALNDYPVADGFLVTNTVISADGTTIGLANEPDNQVTVYRRGSRSGDDDPVPCFHGDTVIALADGKLVRAADLAIGMTVRDTRGREQAINRVVRRRGAACVYFRRDAIAPGVPDRTLIVTPNHLLRLPSGQAVLAGALVEMFTATRGATRVRASGARVACRASAVCGWVDQRLTVYHVAVPEWTFLSVHNIDAETMVQTVTDDRRRQRVANTCTRR